jgi:translation initiation factor IF-2
MSEGRGVEATILVRNGTLRKGDFILSGKGHGTARSLTDDHGRTIAEAGPSTPVLVLGLSEMPEAGDTFYAVNDPRKARELADERKLKQWRAAVVERQQVTLENLYSTIADGKVKELKLIVKADTKGSAEVLSATLAKQSTAEAKVIVLHTGVGGITESDVLLAHASGGIIVGFHTTPEEKARVLAEDKGVEIRQYRVIYELLDDVTKGLEGLLEPEKKEFVLGHAEVRQTFKVSKIGTIAGCYVTDGKILRSARVRLTRDGVVAYEGQLASLKRVKDDVREVAAGFECGIKIHGFDDIKVGDIIEAFEVREVKRTLA